MNNEIGERPLSKVILSKESNPFGCLREKG